jgi:hypothetical protein
MTDGQARRIVLVKHGQLEDYSGAVADRPTTPGSARRGMGGGR